MQAPGAGMRWDNSDNGSDEAPTEEDGSSLWGSDSEDSEDGSIGHSLAGAQRSCKLVICLELFTHVPANFTHASASSCTAVLVPMDVSLQVMQAMSTKTKPHSKAKRKHTCT